MLRIELKGGRDTITARGLSLALDATLRMLSEIDLGFSGRPGGTTDWLIADIRRGSLVLDLTPRTRLDAQEFGPAITRTFVEGMDRLEREGVSPLYLSEAGLEKARQLVRLVGREGITGVHLANGQTQAELTATASANIDQLLRVGREAIGSVEGRLETISLHGPARFVVYHAVTKKAVVCRMDPDKLLDDAKKALGHRVVVTGLVQYNMRGEPARLLVEKIRVLRERDELPPAQQFAGADPDFTGDLASADYLRHIRG